MREWSSEETDRAPLSNGQRKLCTFSHKQEHFIFSVLVLLPVPLSSLFTSRVSRHPT